MPRCSRTFSAYDQFLALCFGQLTYRESLRDIVACLRARPKLQYHLGFRGRLTRTNFAYANEHRDWRVFAAVAEVLIRRAARLYNQPAEALDFPQVAFALDASIMVKQHLRIRHFFGRSENAIRCQIWTAICAYLLVAIAKKQHHLQQSLYEMLQIISISACEHISVNQLFKPSALQDGAPQAQQTPLFLGF